MRAVGLALGVLVGMMWLDGCGSDRESPKTSESRKAPQKTQAKSLAPASPEVRQAVTKTVETFLRALHDGEAETLGSVIEGRDDQVVALDAMVRARNAITTLKGAYIKRFGENAWRKVEEDVEFFVPYWTEDDLKAMLEGMEVNVDQDGEAIAGGTGLDNPLTLRKKDDAWRIQTDSYFKGQIRSREIRDLAVPLKRVIEQITATVKNPDTTAAGAQAATQDIRSKIVAESIRNMN